MQSVEKMAQPKKFHVAIIGGGIAVSLSQPTFQPLRKIHYVREILTMSVFDL